MPRESVAAQPSSNWLQPLEFVTSSGERLPADSGWLVVPSRHGTNGAPDIKLPVLRLRSTNPQPRPPLVYLAGGPGVAGVPTSRDLSPLLIALRAHGDVILYDQRGTGRAQPGLLLPGTLALPASAPLGSRESLARLVEFAQQTSRTMSDRGVDLNAYNTLESVHDLDAIRVALGVERWVVWGHSYGSHLALAYVRAHGAHVERLMIGGVNGTDQRWRLPTDGDAVLTRIDSMLKADARWARVMPDFLAVTKRVLSRLEREPMIAEVNGERMVLGREDLAVTIAVAGGDVAFIERLPFIVAQLDRGNAVPLARNTLTAFRARPAGTAMSYSMHIASGVSPARQRLIEQAAKQAVLGNAINFPFDQPSVTDAFKIADLGESFRAPVTSSVPTLLYSGTLDVRTSLADADAIRKTLPNATHVIVNGASHMPHERSAELRRRMIDFVGGARVESATLSVPIEFHGPDELTLQDEIDRAVAERGVASVPDLLRAMHARPEAMLTSFVPRKLTIALLSTRKFGDAAVVLRAATALFPNASFLFEQLGEALEGSGDRSGAIEAYRRAVDLDVMAFRSAARLKALAN